MFEGLKSWTILGVTEPNGPKYIIWLNTATSNTDRKCLSESIFHEYDA